MHKWISPIDVALPLTLSPQEKKNNPPKTDQKKKKKAFPPELYWYPVHSSVDSLFIREPQDVEVSSMHLHIL